MNRLWKLILSKKMLIALMLLAQVVVIFIPTFILYEFSVYFQVVIRVLSIVLAMYIFSKDINPTYRLAWIMLILISPFLGVLVYLFFGAKQVPKALRIRDKDLQKSMKKYLSRNKIISAELAEKSANAHKQSNYISRVSEFPLYKKTRATYCKLGEDQFKILKEQLLKAKEFIFMEFFIIDTGKMWDELLEILTQKVKEGVDVRLMYDGFGCLSTLPSGYDIELNKLGIKTKVFNKIGTRLAVQLNNRDHRKIVVVDGLIAMTGGINLADEYINEKVRFGHWKDSGCLIEGLATWSFTVMFLQFWNYDEEEKDDYETFRKQATCFENIEDDGYVQPYSDSPTDNEYVGKNTHINMINNANDYIYITTPYLLLDNEMRSSLILAAQNGVDVRIILPHIPDKKLVFELTRYNYEALIHAGVKVYEYTPGFIHSKTFISDDAIAIVGTTNMDYRSYYLHYECGVWFYNSSLINEMKIDYFDTIEKSKLVTREDIKHIHICKRILRIILNLFSPLM